MAAINLDNTHFIKKAFTIFAINSIISSVGVVISTFVDALILGNYLGETGLGVLNVAMPVYMIYNLISFALGIGGSVTVSAKIGEENPADASKAFSATLLYSLLCSVIVAIPFRIFVSHAVNLLGGAAFSEQAVAYIAPVAAFAPLFILTPIVGLMLRSDGDPLLSTIGISVSVAVNLILDLVFVGVMEMGTFGAALAMIIGQAAALGCYCIHFIKKANSLKLSRFHPSLKDFTVLFFGGFGSASSYVYQSIVMIIFNNLLFVSGGTTAIAGYNVLFNVTLFSYAVFDGVSLALVPLVGTFRGEKDFGMIKGTMKYAVRFTIVCGLFIMILAMAGNRAIPAMFGIVDHDTSLTVLIYACSIIFCCVNCTFSSYYQTMNIKSLTNTIQILRGVVLLLGLGVPLINGFGITGLGIAYVASEVLTFLVLVTVFPALLKKRKLETIFAVPQGAMEHDSVYEATVSGSLKELPDIASGIEQFCENNNVDMKTSYYINLTIEELATNIIQFGFKNTGKHYLSLRIAKYDQDIYVRIRDDATGYNPFAQTDEDDSMDYIGVNIIKRKAKTFYYQRKLVFNNLLIIL